MSFFLLFKINAFAQLSLDKFEIGINYGHSVLQHKKSKTDGIMRYGSYRLESEKYGDADLMSIVGGHINSLGIVLNYKLKNNSFIQLGYNRNTRMISADWSGLNFQANNNGNIAFSNPYANLRVPQYLKFNPNFPTSSRAFIHKSRSIPISYRRHINMPGNNGISINPGIGFTYFKNSVNQIVRKSPPSGSLTYGSDIFPRKNQVLHLEMSSRFIDDPFYSANGDLYWYFSLGIQKQFKKGNKLEFDIAYMPNFKDPHYKDYIEFTIETSIYDQTDRENPVLIETIDKGTTRFELRQGGLTFNLRYYPKPFKMNGK